MVELDEILLEEHELQTRPAVPGPTASGLLLAVVLYFLQYVVCLNVLRLRANGFRFNL